MAPQDSSPEAPLVALDRPSGKLDVDDNGMSRYTLNIEVPKGTGHGNEPELSFEYSQGAVNGPLGMGWTLGGISAIRLAPARLAFDGNNDGNIGFDPFKPHLVLDGNLLLNITKGHRGEKSGEQWWQLLYQPARLGLSS